MECKQIHYDISDAGEIEIIYCDNSKINYPKHTHISVYTIGIILDGEICLEGADSKLKYKKNDLYLILPDEPHAIFSGEAGYTMVTVCIKEVYTRRYEEAKMIELFYKSLEEFVQNKLVRYEHIQAVTAIIHRIYAQQISYKIVANVFSDSKRKLENVPEEEISIEELAGKEFISKYHYIREFKKNVGLTPHRFQIQNRIRKAQRLIREGKNLTEVALTTGFYDQSHFVRYFKQIVGITPTEYRDACIRNCNTSIEQE